jgi:hypothetical protein
MSCPCFRRGSLDASGVVHLEGRNLVRVPAFIRGERVKEVWLQDNCITTLPLQADSWVRAEVVYVNGNQITHIPGASAANWVSLQEANFSRNSQLSTIPAEAKAWQSLKQLYLDELPLLTALPAVAVCSWKQLKVLHVNNSALAALPDSVCKLCNLRMLALNDNKLVQLPESIQSWTKVEKIFLNNNLLSSLPDSIGALASLTRLYVTGNQLEKLPPSIGALSVLEELYLSDNRLAEIPPEIGRCTKLSKLYLNNNQLISLPSELSRCTSIEILNGSNNQIHSLPEGFFRTLHKLKFLHLVDNQLLTFPFNDFREGTEAEMDKGGTRKLQDLRAFDVHGNPFLQDGKQAAEAEYIRARLKQPWKFTRGLGPGEGVAAAETAEQSSSNASGITNKSAVRSI